MTTVELDNWFLSVSGRAGHPWDFTFYKNNGEIANQLRTEFGPHVKDIEVDADGDINVETQEYGSFFIRPNGVVGGAWVTQVKELPELGEEAATFAQLLDSAYKATGSFPTASYGVRLFLRFSPENSTGLLLSHGFAASLHSIFGDRAPSNVHSLKFSTKYNREKFFDSIDLEASSGDIQLRYARDAVGMDFSSFRTFLNNVDFKSIVDDIRPLCEPLLAAGPAKRFGRIGNLSNKVK